ncbi:MAG: hypothetical protein ACREPM_25800 [Gemmatimonadaceae bacterium]
MVSFISPAMHETPTALVDLGPDGVVTVRIRDGVHQTLADAAQNLSAALDERAGRRCPILVDIREAQPLEAEVRHYYSGQVLVDGFSALGLLVDASPLGTMLGNVYLRVARPGIPTKLFTQAADAHEWLTTHAQ